VALTQSRGKKHNRKLLSAPISCAIPSCTGRMAWLLVVRPGTVKPQWSTVSVTQRTDGFPPAPVFAGYGSLSVAVRDDTSEIGRRGGKVPRPPIVVADGDGYVMRPALWWDCGRGSPSRHRRCNSPARMSRPAGHAPLFPTSGRVYRRPKHFKSRSRKSMK
jgi:hypothetical protein